MSATVLMLFIATSFLAIATPGPTVLLALSNGASFGVRSALYGMLGAMVSDFILVGAVSVGLGAVLAASETAFTTLKWIGVLYLLYLGIQLLRTRSGPHLQMFGVASNASPQPFRIFRKSFMVAVTNPKGYLFCSAILPQFVAPHLPQAPQYLVLAIAFAALDGCVMLVYASGGARAVQVLRTSAAVLWINRVCGGILVALAGALAFYRRANVLK